MQSLFSHLACLLSTLVEYVEELVLLVSAQGHGFVADGTDTVDDLVGELGLERGHVVLCEQLIHLLHTHALQRRIYV